MNRGCFALIAGRSEMVEVTLKTLDLKTTTIDAASISNLGLALRGKVHDPSSPSYDEARSRTMAFAIDGHLGNVG